MAMVMITEISAPATCNHVPCTDDLFLAGKRSEFLDINIHREDGTQRIQAEPTVLISAAVNTASTNHHAYRK